MNVRKLPLEPKPSVSYSRGTQTHVVQLLQDSKTYTCNLLLLTCQLCSLHSFFHPSLTYWNQDHGWAADITPYVQLTRNCPPSPQSMCRTQLSDGLFCPDLDFSLFVQLLFPSLFVGWMDLWSDFPKEGWSSLETSVMFTTFWWNHFWKQRSTAAFLLVGHRQQLCL